VPASEDIAQEAFLSAGAVSSPGWQTLATISLAALAVIYRLPVPLPRLMNPMLDRDARHRPEGARQRRMAYRLMWGSTGVLISNIGVIGSVTLALLSSGRLG
jgi:hypothetical protein